MRAVDITGTKRASALGVDKLAPQVAKVNLLGLAKRCERSVECERHQVRGDGVEAIEAFGRLADDLRLVDDGVLAHIEFLPRVRRNNHKRDGNRRVLIAAKNGSRTRQDSRYEVVLE